MACTLQKEVMRHSPANRDRFTSSSPSANHVGLRHANISDGTLRAFGVLLALFQAKDRPPHDPISLVGIEEPEASVHPAAAGVLWDAMNEASHFTQVLATTHSVELLDRKDVGPESLLVVEMVDGETRIGPVDQVGQSIIRDRLATPGELLRQNQLIVEQPVAGADSAPALQP